jgi:hypothetical protein
MSNAFPGAFRINEYTWGFPSPATAEERDAARAAYDALPELEKAKQAYAYGEGGTLYDMIEAYRYSIDGKPRPEHWQPRDEHLLAMWMAMPDPSDC